MVLLDFLFPRHSLLGREGDWVTPAELPRLALRPRVFSSDELRAMGASSLDRVIAASSYGASPLLRKAIHTFKYKRLPGVGEAFEEMLAAAFFAHVVVRPDVCVCPVPLHFSRKFWRGFNQAEILARRLALRTELPLRHLLSRVRPTGHQARRSREERLGAMKGAFCVRGRRDRGDRRGRGLHLPQCVYLVDDLFTTGATMEECARTLKRTGVRRVEGIVLAYG